MRLTVACDETAVAATDHELSLAIRDTAFDELFNGRYTICNVERSDLTDEFLDIFISKTK